MLCTIGDLLEDVVVWLAHEPHHASDTPAKIVRTRGGSAANVAMFAAAQFGSSRFIGQVGDDRLGAQLCEMLAADNVDVRAARAGRTGSIVVLVYPNGERTMLTDRGAATRLSELPHDFLAGVTALHVPAYSLTSEPLATTAMAAISSARSRGVYISIDASSTSALTDFGVQKFVDLIARLAPDALLCNQDEAQLLGLSATSSAVGAALTVIKRGAMPTIAITSSGVVTHVDVPAVATIADTTGAGDAFAAGFVNEFVATSDVARAITTAHALASRVLGSPGATLDATHAANSQ